MKRIVLVCGVIAGILSVLWPIISIAKSGPDINFDGGMIYGYASMILAFSLIFVAIRNFRDKHNMGVISFGKAFRIGLYISLIASTIYVVAWLIDYFYFVPDFNEKYTAHVLNKLKAGGASVTEINSEAKKMAEFSDLYKNPLFAALITYLEILPVGLLVSVIAALILKRKTPKQSLAGYKV